MRALLALAALLAATPASANVFKLVQVDMVTGIATGKMPRAVTIADEGATVTLEPSMQTASSGEAPSLMQPARSGTRARKPPPCSDRKSVV